MDPRAEGDDDLTDAEPSAVRVRGAHASESDGLAFHAVLEAIALPAWIHDVDEREILAVNDALVALTRRPRETLVGASTLELYDPADRPLVARELGKLLASTTAETQHDPAHVKLAVSGGAPVHAKVSSKAIPSFRPHARLAIAHEVRDEETANPAPSQSDERWRLFVEMSPAPAVISRVDPRTGRASEFLVVNDALLELTGFTREELLRTPPLDLVHPDDRAELFHDSTRVEAGARRMKFDSRTWRFLRKDGSFIDMHLGSVTVNLESGRGRVTVMSDISARRQAEALMAQSEQRYRTLFEACPVPACVYDLATLQFRAVNEAMVRLYGYSREELLAMGVFDLVAPEDDDMVRGLIADLRKGLRPGILHHAHTFRHRMKGGAEIDVELIAAPVLIAGSKARVVLHKDVTEHKRAENDLVKRARIDAFRADIGAAMTSDEPLPAHFERVVQAMEHHLDLDSVGVWVLDEVSGQLHLQASVGTLDFTTAGGRRLGFGETWIGRAASRGVPLLVDTWDPSMRPLEVTHAQKFGVTHVAAFPLVVRRRVLGVMTASRSSAFPDDLQSILIATATQVAQALGAAFAYEALRISESLSRSILGNMLSALVTLDEDGVIETANPAAVTTFGFAHEELVGRPFVALFDTAKGDPQSLVAQARGRVTQWVGRRKSGERFPCELRLFHLDSLRGSGYAAILNDVSERYEVERMKAEFVSVVSHELRTPLTAIRGSIGLLTGGVFGQFSDDVTEMLSIADRNTQRLISLVNDILDLERLEKGKMELFIQPVRASAVVERSLDSVKPFADQERITLEVRCADEIVLGDGDRLVQVLVNLLSNAVKFSQSGSLVVVSTVVEPSAVMFRVTDHGRGIPPSHRRIIFERFEQVHASDAREKGGTGLGLAISKAIIEQHAGSIGVESEEGVGSTFWFRVPRARD